MEINTNAETLRYDYASFKTSPTQNPSTLQETSKTEKSTTVNAEYDYTTAKAAQQSESEEIQKTDLQENLEKAIEEINQKMESLGQDIRFGFNDDIQQLTVGVYEKSTNRLIRTIPSEETIALSSRFRELTGSLLDQTA